MSVAIVFVWVALSVFEEGTGDEDLSSQMKSADSASQEKSRTTAPQEVTLSSGEDTHTVAPGETLWDISEKYLGNPWYWPKVWSFNPELPNPHWLAPGTRIRIAPQGQLVPLAPEPEPTLSMSEVETNGVFVEGQIGYVAKTVPHVRTEGFLSNRELAALGRIEGSFSETTMLSLMDVVYLKFKKANDLAVGQEFILYRRGDDIVHPITHEKLGSLTLTVGTAKILVVSPNWVTARIHRSFDAISIGDLVGPMNEPVSREWVLTPNETALDGYVVASLVPFLTHVGEQQAVLVDKGYAEGVLPGNTFTVVRQGGDELRGFLTPAVGNSELPFEDIATCAAVDVKEHASTCLLYRAMREVMPGDRAQMRPAPSAPQAQRP